MRHMYVLTIGWAVSAMSRRQLRPNASSCWLVFNVTHPTRLLLQLRNYVPIVVKWFMRSFFCGSGLSETNVLLESMSVLASQETTDMLNVGFYSSAILLRSYILPNVLMIKLAINLPRNPVVCNHQTCKTRQIDIYYIRQCMQFKKRSARLCSLHMWT